MATPGTVAFHTLGCKLNYSETSSIEKLFSQAGYHSIPFEQGADFYIINTCSVTDFADRKCRQIVRKAIRYNPEAKIVMIGCYAQLKPQEIVSIPGVDLVLGAGEKFQVLDYIEALSASKSSGMAFVSPIQKVKEFDPAYSFGDRTRSFLKVQDGCDYNCAFCTIPLARGNSRSSDVQQVVENASRLAQEGVQEIVLTGVNIGDFGKYLDKDTRKFKRKTNFLQLIKALDNVEGVERIRISSIEPNLCSDEIIRFVAHSKKFVPHFHLPLQSGCDDILQAMQRRYRSDLYADRVQFIKAILPDACIGVDVIVGFPGESEDAFLQTYGFLQELDISYLHVFTYSERPNTHASNLGNIVPMEERRRRNKMLRILSEKKKRAFYQKYEGTTQPVLLERSKNEHKMTGFTPNYLKVEVPLKLEYLNTIQNIRLDDLTEKILFNGELIIGEIISSSIG